MYIQGLPMFSHLAMKSGGPSIKNIYNGKKKDIFHSQPLTNRGDLHRIEAAQKVYTIGHSILARNHDKSSTFHVMEKL